MKTIEVKAKTIHEAIEDACAQLGVAQDEADIEILEQGGMFKKCCIRATVKETEKVAAPKITEKVPTEKPKTTPKSGKTLSVKGTRGGEDCSSKEPQRGGSGDTKRHASSADASASLKDKVLTPTSSITKSKSASKFTAATDFVTKLLELLENDSAVTTEHTEDAFNINVNGEHIGRLIGKNGVVLNALQTLVSNVARNTGDPTPARVFVNVGDYKEKRGDSLQALATKKAEYVKSSGRFVKLEPMNARDRAIIHTILSSVEGIKTYSTGRDPFRCLCIAPADKE
jgi:spoIIIJ-associated protein